MHFLGAIALGQKTLLENVIPILVPRKTDGQIHYAGKLAHRKSLLQWRSCVFPFEWRSNVLLIPRFIAWSALEPVSIPHRLVA